MASSTPNSRPIHPCYLSVWPGTMGTEYSTWANITGGKLPDLVTAQASTLNVYALDESTGKLLLVHSFPNLAGSVCYLEALQTQDETDSLLIGFSGHPRLSVVSVQATTTLSSSSYLLLASSLFDLASALAENSYGSVAPLEQDLIAQVLQTKNIATLSIILGGGAVVVCVQLQHNKETGWTAGEPFVLPLSRLSKSLKFKNQQASQGAVRDQSIVTGFGDILSTAFLPGYLEPTILLLHANPQSGRTWSGRLGRQNGTGGTRFGMMVTALSVTVPHRQSAVLWSVEVPSDALSITSIGTQGCLVICVNALVYVENLGQIKQCLAVNGWVKSTLPSSLLEVAQANPWPFPKLSIQLDGSKESEQVRR